MEERYHELTLADAEFDIAAPLSLQALPEWVKNSKTVTPDGEILMPGEIEQRTRAQRLRDGIELDSTTWGQIRDTAASMGVETGALT